MADRIDCCRECGHRRRIVARRFCLQCWRTAMRRWDPRLTRPEKD